MRSVSLRHLLALASQPAKVAAEECHREVASRLDCQAQLTRALSSCKMSSPQEEGPRRTLRMLVEGVGREMGSLGPLLESNVERYHRELELIEMRYSTFIETVVEATVHASNRTVLNALEGLVESHVGAALLLRHQLKAHHLNKKSAVEEHVDLKKMVLDCTADASTLAFLDADDLFELEGFDTNPTVAGVPHHAAHALLEILKNALQSHLESNVKDKPVRVRWSPSESRLTVEDFGKGLEGGSKAFKELARLRPGKRYDRIDQQTSYAAVSNPLGGIQVGLFVAKVHANHFKLPQHQEEDYLLLDSPGPSGLGAIAHLILPNSLNASETLRDLEPLTDALNRL